MIQYINPTPIAAHVHFAIHGTPLMPLIIGEGITLQEVKERMLDIGERFTNHDIADEFSNDVDIQMVASALSELVLEGKLKRNKHRNYIRL